VYVLVGKAVGELGNAVWMGFVAAMVAAGLTGLSYACLGSRYPRAAGASYMTQRAFGMAWLTLVVGLAATRESGAMDPRTDVRSV
jgi:amino acid transporter